MTTQNSQNCGKVLVPLTGQGPSREQGPAPRCGRARPPPHSHPADLGRHAAPGGGQGPVETEKGKVGLSSNTPTPLDGLVCP